MSLYIKTVISSDDSLRIKVVSVTGTPYVDCLNKNESLESLLKRCIVVLPDGTYALQVNYS